MKHPLITDAVPIPPRRHKGRSKYGFHIMGVGDSFFVKDGFLGSPCPAYNSMMLYNLKFDRKFRADNVHGGIRIWRVE